MVIGGIQSGKSTLAEKLLGSGQTAVKTQALNFLDWIVDTPGEYTENPLYYRAIMVTLLEVSSVILVQDATRDRAIFPPGFTSGMNKKLIGVITKADHPNADLERAEQFLRQGMPSAPIVTTSSYTGKGIPELLSLLGVEDEKTSPVVDRLD